PESWRENIRSQIEEELEQRVRDALETPPLERIRRNRERARLRYQERLSQDFAPNVTLSLDKCREYSEKRPHQIRDILQSQVHFADDSSISYGSASNEEDRKRFQRYIHRNSYYASEKQNKDGSMRHDQNGNFDSMKDKYQNNRVVNGNLDDTSSDDDDGAGINPTQKEYDLTERAIRNEVFGRYTRPGFRNAIKRGKVRDGSRLKQLKDGKYIDSNDVILTLDGPFWPPEHGPLFPKPVHIECDQEKMEPLSDDVPSHGQTIHNQKTTFTRRWDKVISVFDSERTTKGSLPHDVPEGCAPSLMFESRFESGNLRQARRIGQFEYELVLKTDLYTNRHTQWFYFRVQRMRPGVTYKFNIVNLLKRDSLYNHGMRPLLYSEKVAQDKSVGWLRSGHHISYSRNYNLTRNPLLHSEMVYYVLEWQMEFPAEHDTCYLAHCYPYTFTDLKEHIECLVSNPHKKKYIKKEVMCETKAGNSCFLLTITSPEDKNRDEQKKGVVVSARVHPGETNSSWMMKGLLEFLTSNDTSAKELRRNFVFKIVPMLNPDGVIVGNYRCSLAARDLNRNYRHPKKESFPTIWHTKSMLEDFAKQHEMVVYCDLHGHSRKHNVFIYGCNSGMKGEGGAASFLQDRLFPWMMSVKAPDKFSFRGCKFQVKKCKESTGRVVMWRQLGISNSFTMEATFCGSKNLLSAEPPRHFTSKDFESMGKHFCEVVLDYTKAKENKRVKRDSSLYSELILELTRQLTHQILEKRGMLPPSMPDFSSRLSDSDSDNEKRGKNVKQEKQDDNSKTRQPPRAILPKNLLDFGSKQSAIQMLDDMSAETIDSCIRILEDLDITKAFNESDSSDSDSEPEPELPPEPDDDTEKKHKKKKKKKKRSKSVPDGSHESTPASLHHVQPTTLPEVTGAEAERQKKKQAGQLGKCVNMVKKYPVFVNKYQRRSNNGIPMFAQERLDERATKRMEEMKKLLQDKQEKEAAGVKFSDETQLRRLLALTKSLQEEEYNIRKFKLDEGSNSAAMATFKHGYTHAGLNVRGPPTLLEYQEQNGDSSDDTCQHQQSPPPSQSLPPQPHAAIKSPYNLLPSQQPQANSPPTGRCFRPSKNDSFREKNTDKSRPYLSSTLKSTDQPYMTMQHNNVYLRTGAGSVQYANRKPVSADVFSSNAVPRLKTSHSESTALSKLCGKHVAAIQHVQEPQQQLPSFKFKKTFFI
ncbi:uncharacterized protein LOC100369281, partial [Saccoglossus kowalevskii]